MSIIQSGTVNASQFNYQISLAFVVIVITTGVSTVEGANNAGFALVVIEQLLTYLPSRFGGEQLVFVLFAAGALQYANHPEGILEFQKRKWTLYFENLLFHDGGSSPAPGEPPGGVTVGTAHSPALAGGPATAAGRESGGG
jgi:hypothetical protein